MISLQARVGFIINILCVGTVTIAINTYGIPYFNLNDIPDWAIVKTSDTMDGSIYNLTTDFPYVTSEHIALNSTV